MKKKVLIVLAALAVLSLSACSDMSAPPVSQVESESPSTTPASMTESTAESDSEDTFPFEQVKEPSDKSESTQEEQSTVDSTPTVRTSENAQNQAQQPIATSEPEQITQVPVSTEPTPPISQQPTPPVQEPEPTPEPVPEPTPEPVQPSFDVSRYISYAKSYGQSIGLTLDSSAVSCWDDPITANANCIYLERDIRDRLDWYLASGYTAFTAWSEDVGGGNYLIYIGYA